MKKRYLLVAFATSIFVVSGCGEQQKSELQAETQSVDESTEQNAVSVDGSMKKSHGTNDSLLNWVRNALGMTSEYDVPNSTSELKADGKAKDGIGEYSADGIAAGDAVAKKKSDAGVGYKETSVDTNTSTNLSKYKNTNVEFVSYPSQTISANTAMVFSNLSCNSGVTIQFSLSVNGKQFVSERVNAGGSWSVNSKDLGLGTSKTPYKMEVVSQAYAEDGTKLSAVSQEVSVTVTEGAAEKQTSEKYDNQGNGTTYETAVVYEADNTIFSAVVPAVVSVAENDVGSDISVGFRVLNAKKGMIATIKASGDDGKADVVLTGGDNSLKATLSGESSGEPSLKHVYSGGEDSLEEVGPIHCTTDQGKPASSDYFGTVLYKLSLTGI